ncbi:PilN domain-containing protein [Thalassotalea profundi]|uniref:PilN domain-containing protein n=1 Tax=Thalassotalea profundi TaxID=2036687 RepID=A0ABQ3J3G4_9GAMM|nr:PilN domain-containing protein [Thalassotalea profundi]GHE99082.1 hypothetical protein GCM10011501_30780 [Thalassotalea profundi]
MPKLAINLLQPELLPKRPLLSLARVVFLWCALLIFMIAWMVYSQISTDNLARQYQQVNQQQLEQQKLLDELQQKVSSNRADAKLLERLNKLKVVLANKKVLHNQLTDQSQTYAAGFSSAMTELAMLHHKSVSLEQVNMNQGQLSFSGVAKTADSVPQWLAGFESSTFLSGKQFTHFSLSENEEGLTMFSVSTTKVQPVKGGN